MPATKAVTDLQLNLSNRTKIRMSEVLGGFAHRHIIIDNIYLRNRFTHKSHPLDNCEFR